MADSKNLTGKMIFVTGGSGGLGKALSQILAGKNAHIAIFARTQSTLDTARNDIRLHAKDPSQLILAHAVDLSDASLLEKAFRLQPQLPDALYCAAGGNHAENGFLLDIDASAVDTCMRNNYFASAFAAKTVLDMWLADDLKRTLDPSDSAPKVPRTRRIVFISSAAAFVGLPGSVAYTPAKVAVRALADTLRLECLRYSNAYSKYTVHISFPADFVSPGFYLEQETKTPLTKRMQGTNLSIAELEAKYPSSEEVAKGIVEAVERDEFVICSDSMNASALFTGMMGPSPKRGWGIWDGLVGIVMALVVWPALRMKWEALCRADGEVWRKKWMNDSGKIARRAD